MKDTHVMALGFIFAMIVAYFMLDSMGKKIQKISVEHKEKAIVNQSFVTEVSGYRIYRFEYKGKEYLFSREGHIQPVKE